MPRSRAWATRDERSRWSRRQGRGHRPAGRRTPGSSLAAVVSGIFVVEECPKPARFLRGELVDEALQDGVAVVATVEQDPEAAAGEVGLGHAGRVRIASTRPAALDKPLLEQPRERRHDRRVGEPLVELTEHHAGRHGLLRGPQRGEHLALELARLASRSRTRHVVTSRRAKTTHAAASGGRAKAAETQRLRTIASPAIGLWKRSCQAVSWPTSRYGGRRRWPRAPRGPGARARRAASGRPPR